MKEEGIVFDVQRWSIRDGYGIRTNVFLKGCPLRCKWCCNPESQKLFPELAFFPDKCISCRNCERDCPHQAIHIDENGVHSINWSVCAEKCFAQQNGFACLAHCYAEAMKLMGKKYTVDQVMQEVLSDVGIYRRSGGGVTFTGGEPYMQPEFLLALLKRSKEESLHTTVETSASVKWEVIEKTLPWIDFLFVDLKIFDGKKHAEYTGQNNSMILENIRNIDSFAGGGTLTTAIRMPIIPGVNNTEENVRNAAEWICANLENTHIFQPLAYHRLGRGKYMDIGRAYELEEVPPLPESELNAFAEIIRSYGLKSKYD